MTRTDPRPPAPDRADDHVDRGGAPAAQQNLPALLAAGLAGAALGTALLARRRPEPGSAELRAAALRLLEVVLPSQRSFAVQLWDGTTIPATLPERARLIALSERSIGRILHLPLDMAMGEAYLLGDFEVEGDLAAIVSVFDHYDARFTRENVPQLLRDVATLRHGARLEAPSVAAQLSGETHSRARDLQAISYHYDVSNDFYKLFLDGRMVYSCAYFPTGSETLDEAQAAKLDLICRKLRLKPGERLLDIGCGWGGLAIYAAQHYGVHVTGVTLSKEQLAEGRARVRAAGLEHLVTLELRDYRDVPQAHAPFDKITSVGMAEHVGRKRMADYFETAWKALKPGGLMLNHAISDGLNSVRAPALLQSGNFARKYVFPDGELLPIWETLKFAEGAQFEVRDVESLREHYARTLRLWVDRLMQHQDEGLALIGPQRFRVWRLYMSACAYYFQDDHISLMQTLLAKPDEQRQVPLPPGREDIYR